MAWVHSVDFGIRLHPLPRKQGPRRAQAVTEARAKDCD